MNVDGVSNNLQGGARNLVISPGGGRRSSRPSPTSRRSSAASPAACRTRSRARAATRLHGSAYLFTRQDWLSARPFLLAPTAPEPEFQRYNYGGTAGGPVVRDRSFYFVSYERWSQDLPVVSTITPANAAALGIPADEHRRLHHDLPRAHADGAQRHAGQSSDHRLSFRYNYYYDRESPLNGGLIAREVSTRFDESPYSYTAQLVSVLGPKLVNEARFLYADSRHRERRVGRSRRAEHRHQRHRQLQRQRQRHQRRPARRACTSSTT